MTTHQVLHREEEATNSAFLRVPPDVLNWEALDGGVSVGDKEEKQL